MASLMVEKGVKKESFKTCALRDLKSNRQVYLMFIPVAVFYILFYYMPMGGLVIAFKDYTIGEGFMRSDWVGFKHFYDFFTSFDFIRVIKNTFAISFLNILFSFPAPIIFALLLNEVRHKKFKKTVQTITYMPYFISMVVICGMLKEFSSIDGIFNDFMAYFGIERTSMLMKPEYFRPIYITSGIWQTLGWNTIIYLAALTSIDVAQYEAASLDGANRFQKVIHVTLPGIMPTIILLLILQIGSMLNVGFEKIILLYNANTFETADVISTYVYRLGLQDANYSYSTAIGMFNSIVNFVFVMGANYISKKFSGTGLW